MANVTVIAAAAAAARRRMEQEEEERMTAYTPEELAEDWEFKIVRASRPVFRNPETLRKLVEEEARAGWVLVEKFDDMRVRFKRPRSARERDAMLPPDVDPYRTVYGMSESTIVAITLGTIGAFIMALTLVILLVVAAR